MAKKDKAVVPFELDINISLEKLEGVPPSTSPHEIAKNWLIMAIKTYGDTHSKGFQIQNQRSFFAIRTLLDDAVKNKTDKVVFDVEDWRFLKKCWDEVQLSPSANEVIIRIDDKMREAVSNHDRSMSENGQKKDDDTVSSQEIAPS